MEPKTDRFYVAYCRNCGDISAMSWADSEYAEYDIVEWKDDGRPTGIIKKNECDTMPKWCDCGNCY